MSWYRQEAGAPDHPKVRKLARLAKLDQYTAFGHLSAFWCRLVNIRPDGNLAGFDLADLGDIAGATDAHAFGKALVEAGLVDSEDGENPSQVHDWMERAEAFKRAKKEQERREEKRKVGKRSSTRGARVSVTDGRTDGRDGRTDVTDETDETDGHTDDARATLGEPWAAPNPRKAPADNGIMTPVVVGLYREICEPAGMPPVKRGDPPKLSKRIAAITHDVITDELFVDDDGTEWWRCALERAAESNFVRGKGFGLDWLVKRSDTGESFAERAYAGKYANTRQRATGPPPKLTADEVDEFFEDAPKPRVVSVTEET